ncbi:MAG TPA: hypothetical protein VHG30_11260, partial [Microvirga sp.]|nr:hypothetical protein [Microvirga sp.]
TVSEFVLSTADPPGVIDGEAAAWLVTGLSGVSPRTAAAVVRATAADAQHVHEAFSCSSGEPRRRTVVT